MSEENSLLIKPKLNFFQRWRKNNLIKKISYRKYEKSPDYLKNDDEVIFALVSKSPYMIEKFPLEKKLDLLKKNPDFFKALSKEEKIKIIEKEPTYITRLREEEVLIFITENLNKRKSFIKYLPEEFQLKLLTQDNEYGDYYNTYRGYSRKKTIPIDFSDKLDCFSTDVVEKAAIYYVSLAKEEKAYYWEDKRKRVRFLSEMKIENLPIELQLKLVLLDEEFLKIISEEAAEKYVGNNPLLIKNLSTDKQIEIIKKHPEFFSVLDHEAKGRCLNRDLELRKIIPEEEKVIFDHKIGKVARITDVEILKKLITKYNWRNVSWFSTFTDYVREPNMLIELARFEPSVLSTWGLHDFEAHKKTLHTINLYKKLINNPDVIAELEKYPNRFIKMQVLERNKVSENLPKVLLNEKVLAKTPPELLIKFINNPTDRNILQDIIATTYGEENREFFEKRPNITLEQIPCLEIFDPIVVEKFGKGTVNNMMNYSTNSAAILGELVRNPEKMRKFEEFEKIFGSEKDDVLGFNDKLLAYNDFKDLLHKIDISSLTEKQKENLLLMCNDNFMTLDGNETKLIKVESLEELENYDKKRNDIYDDYVKKVISPEKIKNAIARRFFGMRYENELDEYFKRTSLSLNGMVYYYNLENFTSDERTINGGMFTEDEIDMLELATIINKIKDPEVLREIYNKLAERKDVLTPVDFAKTKSKIPLQYSKELVDTLLTVEDAKKRAQNGENGITYEETEDGLEIIRLSGADFKIMLHTTGLNNSGLNIPWDADPVEVWKYFEKGCSTISGCVIEPQMLKSCASQGSINFGFSNMPIKQILGMSHHDAHVSHGKGEIDPRFEFAAVQFNYPDELIRKTAAQITGQEATDPTHPYNEIAMYRNYVEKKSEKFGEKIMPDYIVVYGNANDKHKKIAKKFEKNGKPIPIIEIDIKAYGDRTRARGSLFRKEDHSVKRQSNEIISEIKDIVSELEEK